MLIHHFPFPTNRMPFALSTSHFLSIFTTLRLILLISHFDLQYFHYQHTKSTTSHSHTLSKSKKWNINSFMCTLYKLVYSSRNCHYRHYSHIIAIIMTNQVDKLIEERIRTLTVIVN